MKELYTNPEVEVIEFDTKDVITTSDCTAYDPYNCPFDFVTCSNDVCPTIDSPEF